MCRYESDDEAPPEELNEDGFTAQENQVYKKVNGKERGPSLFRDLSLADKAVVDGGMSSVWSNHQLARGWVIQGHQVRTRMLI